MADLAAALPTDLSITMADTPEATAGYESTLRSSTDQGAAWSESADVVEVTLTILAMRGQPAAAMAIEATATSLTVTAWGRAIWTCVLRGTIDPNTASMIAEDGMGSLPILQFSARKAPAVWWGGFIKSIGEDSLIN